MSGSVTIHVARNLSDALLLKGFLESSGIPAFVPGEFETGYDTLEGSTDARVQVQAENVAQAREIVLAWVERERASREARRSS